MERTLIAPGVHLSCDPASKFNRCRISIHFAFPAQRKTATAHALLPLVMERGYADCPDMTRLTKKLAKLYGADLTVDARPMGCNHNLCVSVTGIKDAFALEGEALTAEYTKIALGAAFHPYLVDGCFDPQAVSIEKQMLKKGLEDEINDKRNPTFFGKYSRMPRSKEGLAAAGEWHVLRRMLPPFEGKRVLDLGCGFGWHCRYAVEQGAASVVGVDLSERMLAEARAMTDSPAIQYLRMPIEAIDFPADSFDVAISSLAFHYIESFGGLCAKVNRCLSAGGRFVFSVEHPVFTAQGSQEWHCDAQGNHLHWPVDSYFSEGVRKAGFLGEEVMKYHKTLTAYVNGLLQNGFELLELVEPQPEPGLLEAYPEIMRDELRRPMMLLVSARKR